MNLADFHFIRPYWFIALLPVIILIILSVRNKLARGNWSEVCDEALLPFILQDSDKKVSRRWSSIALSFASVLAIIALAGPTWERLPTPVFRNDAAVVIALDLSRSMNATDIKPSRLIRARYKVADILQHRHDGLTALIAYAGDAFTVTPLTEDTATISNQINALNTDIMPSQGSNTSAALKQAVELLKQAGQSQGGILLISDGISPESIEQAKSILGNYKLSILGIGTSEGSPVKLADGGFLKDRKGNIVIPKLNASQLTALAQAGGGIYQTISADDSDINALITHSARAMSKEDTDNDRMIEQWVEQGPWLLLLLLPLAAFYFRKGLLIIPLIAVMNYPQDSYAYEWQDLWQTPDQQAQQAFDQKHYDEAAAKFSSPEWQAAAQYKAEKYQQAAETLQPLKQQTADDYYNQATSLAKAGKLEPALDLYQKALDLDPQHEDAIYNKKLVEDALKKQQQDQQKKNNNDSKKDNKNQQNQDKKQSDPSDQKQADNKDNNQDSSKQKQDKQSQNKGDPKNKQDDNKQQQSDAGKDQKKEDDKQAGSESDKKQDNNEQQDQTAQQQQTEQSKNDEDKQAQAQWLNRIQDDPAGLLKRKFKYQYNQRNQSSQQEQTW